MKNIRYTYKAFPASKTAWDNLSMQEKSEMMKVAVRNGITDLKTIRDKYNEFAEGGNKRNNNSWYQQHQSQWYGFLRNKGVSDADAQRLSGFFTAQDDLESAGGRSSAARQKNNFGGMQKGGKNITYNSVNDYMEDKWRMMNSRFKPALSAKNINEYATILGNPETAGKGYLYYVTDKVKYNPKDPAWQAAQRQHMQNYINGMKSRAGQKTVTFTNPSASLSQKPIVNVPASTYVAPPIQEYPDFTPLHPEVFQGSQVSFAPPILEEQERQTPVTQIYSPEETARQEKAENLRRFSTVLGLLNASNEDNSLSGFLGLFGNSNGYFAKGGDIHIKPSHRGRLTELKARTGKTEAELYNDGNPAHKKMVVFARNARKWHGLGGNLFDGESQSSQQMEIGRPFWQSQAQEPTFMESLAEFNRQQELKKQQQIAVLRQKTKAAGKKLMEERIRDASVESNDNAWVETPLTYNKKNPHLSHAEGAKVHAAPQSSRRLRESRNLQ